MYLCLDKTLKLGGTQENAAILVQIFRLRPNRCCYLPCTYGYFAIYYFACRQALIDHFGCRPGPT